MTGPMVLACVCFGLPMVCTAEGIVRVDDAQAAARAGAPVATAVDLKALFPEGVDPARLQWIETTGGVRDAAPIAAQFEPARTGAAGGVLWWVMPPGDAPSRQFRLVVAEQPNEVRMRAAWDKRARHVDLADGKLPVLRYSHGTVPVRVGIPAHYARGDYISVLYGLAGEVLTDDYPADHPHHRGVSWSWPVTRWNDEVRDIWAVRGVWARPVAIKRVEAGPVMALVEAESVWRWGDKDAIVNETVVIRAFGRSGQMGQSGQAGQSRTVDVEVTLTALVDGVAIGGRPHAGYGGFGLRAAPCRERQITVHADPAEAEPRRAWLDYSGIFGDATVKSGVAIFENRDTPDYPSVLLTYPQCNYVMPGFPGDREIPLRRGEPLVLRNRLWIHAGGADESALAAVWAAYAAGVQSTVVTAEK